MIELRPVQQDWISTTLWQKLPLRHFEQCPETLQSCLESASFRYWLTGFEHHVNAQLIGFKHLVNAKLSGFEPGQIKLEWFGT